jgi:hypothetical protein
MLAVADAFESASVALDGAGGSDIVREAGNEDAVQAERAGLLEHLSQCPAGQAAASCAWAYAVTDVAEMVIEPVPQGDPTKQLAVLDDPPG